MEWVTLALRLPSAPRMASTLTRCDAGKGKSLEISSKNEMSVVGCKGTATPPRILEAIIPNGATSTDGSSQTNCAARADITRGWLRIEGVGGAIRGWAPERVKAGCARSPTAVASADNSTHFSSGVA